MRTILDYLHDNLVNIIGMTASVVAAFVATKTYLLELRFRRNKFRVEVKHVKDGSHISVAVTNIGAPCVIDGIVAEIDTASPLVLKRRTDRLEYGTQVQASVTPETIHEIPVYVHGRIVITLTDGSQHVCEAIPFGKMVNLAQDTVVFSGTSSPKQP